MQKTEKTLMPPPWLAFPYIERYSIGWRMGAGEDYIYRFFQWLRTHSPEEQLEYRALFPEPVTWKGWWDNEETCEALEHGNCLLPLWQPSGVPKYTAAQIQQEAANGKTHDLCLFWGHQPAKDGSITKSCFSQWWKEKFMYVVTHYFCMEQFMMEQKAKLFEDGEIRKQILECQDPAEIKKLGRKVQNFDQALWDTAKYTIVLNGNWCKFSQNRALRDFLLSTGDSILVEASPYDGVWGIRLPANSPDAQNPLKWRGENLLGFALMEVRDELRRITKNESLCDFSTVEE